MYIIQATASGFRACKHASASQLHANQPYILLLPLQNDKSQANLIAKLHSLATKSPVAVQQMLALYDGTEESLLSTPDVQLFCRNLAGWHATSNLNLVEVMLKYSQHQRSVKSFNHALLLPLPLPLPLPSPLPLPLIQVCYAVLCAAAMSASVLVHITLHESGILQSLM